MVSPKKSLSTSAVMNILNQLSAVLFPVITFPYVSRVLLPENVGKVSFAQALVSYFVMFAMIGIPIYGTREVARIRDDILGLKKLVIELFLINSSTTVISLTLYIIFVFSSQKALSDPYLFAVCAIPIICAPFSFLHFMQGTEEFVFITLRSVLIRLISLLCVFIFVNTVEDYRLYAFISASALGVSNFINTTFVLKKVGFDWSFSDSLLIFKHVKPIFAVFSLAAVISIYTEMDKVMLGYLSGDSDVGYYTVADRLIKVVVILVTSFGAVLLPRVSYYLENNLLDEYRDIIDFSLKVVLFLALPAAIGLFVLADPLVSIFAGSNYTESVMLMRIMAANIVLIAISNFFGYQILYPHNKEKLLIQSVFMGAMVNVILNTMLIPILRAEGAALATLISELMVTSYQTIVVRKFYKMKWPIFTLVKYAFTALLMGLVVSNISEIIVLNALKVVVGLLVGICFYLLCMIIMRDELFMRIIARISQYIGKSSVGGKNV